MQTSVDHIEEPGVDPKRIGNRFSVLRQGMIRFMWRRLEVLWKEKVIVCESFSVCRAIFKFEGTASIRLAGKAEDTGATTT